MRAPPTGWPPDDLLAKAAKALAPYLGREATAKEARELLLKMRGYFHLLREGEDRLAQGTYAGPGSCQSSCFGVKIK